MASSANASLLHTTTYFSITRLDRHALRPSEGATMWRPFSSTTRTLSLSSLRSSSSSSAPSPFIVRSSFFSSSPTYASNWSNVKVWVWWDFETCELPTGVSVSQVLPIITAALKANGINGPIQMYARGNIKNLSIENQEAISTSGIDFEHIEGPLYRPRARQHRVYRAIINHLNVWDWDNNPPLHLFFISGYDYLTGHLLSLVEENYNVLVASTGSDKELFFSFANIAFDWNSLIRGENLTGHRREFSLSRRLDWTTLRWLEPPFLENVIPEVEDDGFSSTEEV